MHQRKSGRIVFFIFLIFFVGSINNIKLNNFLISGLENINISGLDEADHEIIFKKIIDLNFTNIFFLNKKEIKSVLNSNTLIQNYEVFKRYPSQLDIKIEKTKFLAKINKNGKVHLVGSNGKFSNQDYSNLNLPYIFGNPEINEFLYFKKILDQSPIMFSEIKNLYFFQSKRWDIELKNNILIKLPEDTVSTILRNVSEFIKQNNLKNSKIIDARVKNQIIVND